VTRVLHPPRASSTSSRAPEGYATLEFRRFFRHSPSEVWEAITNPEQVQQWFVTRTKTQARAGGRIELETGPERVRASGRILAWDPPRLYEFEWNTSARSPHFPGERSIIRWELTAGEGGTFVVLTHRDLTRRTAQVFGRGLPTFLDRLGALLDGTTMPDHVWATPP